MTGNKPMRDTSDPSRHGYHCAACGRLVVTAVDGLSRHDYDLQRWLATEGMDLTWRGAPTQ